MTIHELAPIDQALLNPDIKEIRGALIGMAAIIVNARTGEIWTIKEKLDKEATGRRPGQLSVPLETRKAGESPFGNLQGAIAEAFDDVNGRLSERLYPAGNVPQTTFIINESGSTILCDVSILLHEGSNTPSQPYSHEVEDGRWMKPQDFLSGDCRPLARTVVERALAMDLIPNGLKVDHSKPVFPLDFSVRNTSALREMLPDVI